MTRRELGETEVELKGHMEALNGVGEVMPPTVQEHLTGLMKCSLRLLAEADVRVPFVANTETQTNQREGR